MTSEKDTSSTHTTPGWNLLSWCLKMKARQKSLGKKTQLLTEAVLVEDEWRKLRRFRNITKYNQVWSRVVCLSTPSFKLLTHKLFQALFIQSGKYHSKGTIISIGNNFETTYYFFKNQVYMFSVENV
jgi:hypothetical protein